MSPTLDRRTFLENSATTLAGLGGVATLANFNVVRAKGPTSAPESLMRLIESTPRDKIAPVFVEQLRKGLTRDDLLAGLFLTATRISKGHNLLVHHSVTELSSSVAREDRLLPLFWHLDLIKCKLTSPQNPRWKDSQLPKPTKAASVFEDAVRELDQDKAAAAIVAIARSEGPKVACRRLWTHSAGARLFGSAGHAVIRLANTWRSMDKVGWQEAEQILDWNARGCSGTKTLPKGHLHLTNARLAGQHGKLPGDWMKNRSDPGAVVELHSLFREGKASDACKAVYEQLQSGKVFPGSIWDAVFLTTNELSVRYKFGGPSGRPRHSITSANAMHFMYRTWTDPQTRLFTLLQAVAMTCSFVASTRGAGDLNAFDITKIEQIESPTAAEDAVAEIFSLLPPRRSEHRFRDRSGQEKALGLTYVMARQHSDQLFLRTARRLLCSKCCIDAHNLKFPMAAFENYRYLSPKWRPHFLAGSVFLLHGTQMEDNPAVQQAREALRKL